MPVVNNSTSLVTRSGDETASDRVPASFTTMGAAVNRISEIASVPPPRLSTPKQDNSDLLRQLVEGLEGNDKNIKQQIREAHHNRVTIRPPPRNDDDDDDDVQGIVQQLEFDAAF